MGQALCELWVSGRDRHIILTPSTQNKQRLTVQPRWVMPVMGLLWPMKFIHCSIVVTVELPLAYLQASHVQSYFRVDSVSWWTLGLCVTLQATVFGGLMQIYGIKNNNHRTQVFSQNFFCPWNVRRVTFLPLTKENTSSKLYKELTTP